MPNIPTFKQHSRLTSNNTGRDTSALDVYEFNEPGCDVKPRSTKEKQCKHRVKPEVVQGVLNLIFKTQQSIQHLREREQQLIAKDQEQDDMSGGKSKLPSSKKKSKTETKHEGKLQKRGLDVSVSSAACVHFKKTKYKIKTGGSIGEETIGLLDRKRAQIL